MQLGPLILPDIPVITIPGLPTKPPQPWPSGDTGYQLSPGGTFAPPSSPSFTQSPQITASVTPATSQQAPSVSVAVPDFNWLLVILAAAGAFIIADELR